MKKLLFKKSSIMLVAVGLIVAGVSSAALVSYLSNEVTTTKTVIKSPIEISLYGNKSSTDTASWHTDYINLNHTIIGDIYGGSKYEVRMNRENLANQKIKNYLEIRIDPTTGSLASGDIDLTMQYHNGTAWVPAGTFFPCQIGYASGSAYYRTEIRDIAQGVTKFKIMIDFNQALDPTDTYKMFIQALDPDVVPSANKNVGECPWN